MGIGKSRDDENSMMVKFGKTRDGNVQDRSGTDPRRNNSYMAFMLTRQSGSVRAILSAI